MVGHWDDKKYRLIPNPGCMEFFRSRAPDEDLRTNVFVYQVVRKNEFVVARWISDDLFIPITSMGSNPVLNDEIVMAYLSYCYPERAPDMAKALKQAKDNQIDLEESHEQDKRETRAKILRDEFHIKVPDHDGTCHLPVGLVGTENTCG